MAGGILGRSRLAGLIGGLALVGSTVACGAVTPTTTATAGPLPPPVAASAPATPNHVAWQAPIGADPVIVGGVVVAMTNGGIQEFDAHTGDLRWTWKNTRETAALRFLVADSTVFAVVGHDVGTPPAMVAPIAAELDALDLRTGRFLWSHPIAGTQSPGFAVASPVVAIADSGSAGAVVGLDPRTGRRRWTEPAPAGCAVAPNTVVTPTTYLAGDGDDLAVGRRCGAANSDLIQGIDPATGRSRWTVSAVGSLDVFTIPPGSRVLAASLAHIVGAHPAPGRVWSVPDAPVGFAAQQVVVIDAATGRVVWQESGMSDLAAVTGDAAALCVIDGFGYECRKPSTGALVFPPPVSARAPVGPYGDSAAVTQADGSIYQLDTGSAHATRVLVRSATTGALTGTISVDVSRVPAPDTASQSGLITAGDGLLLIRRADVAGFPVLAMAAG
jgi:outer membrane protein assembly factor BamB